MPPVRILTAGFALSACAAFGQGAAPAEGARLPEYNRAIVAMSDGLYGMAANFWKSVPMAGLEARERERAALLMSQALILSGRGEDASLILDKLTGPDAVFWQGEADYLTGRLSSALKRYESVPEGSALFDAALWRRSRIEFRLGNETGGEELLQLLAQSKERDWKLRALLYRAERLMEKQLSAKAAELIRESAGLLTEAERKSFFPFLWTECRLASEQGKWDRVAELAGLLDEQNVPVFYRDGARYLLATSLAAQGDDADAARMLVALIEEHTESLWLPAALHLLSSLPQEGGRVGMSRLASWAAASKQPLTSMSLVSLAERLEAAGRPVEALGLYLSVTESAAPVDVARTALFRACVLLERVNATAAARQLAERLMVMESDPKVLSRLRFLFALDAVDKPAEAAKQFEEISAMPNVEPQVRQAAVVNAVLSRLRLSAGNLPAPDDFEGLAGLTRAQWLLEGGLYHLSGDPESREQGRGMLEDFLRIYKASPERLRAMFALIDDALRSDPPELKKSGVWLAEADALLSAAAATAPAGGLAPSPMAFLNGAAERTVRLHVLRLRHIELADPGRFVAEAQAFLRANPSGSEFEEVSMRLARFFFDKEDFAQAGVTFSALAASTSSPQIRESALFFSARASMAMMNPAGYKRARSLLTEVVKIKGSLEREARLLDGMLRVRLGLVKEAVEALEPLAARGAADGSDLRWRAVQTLAELWMTGAAASADTRAQAVRICASLRDDSTAPVAIRFQAARQVFLYLRTLNRADEAIEQAYQLIRSQTELSENDLVWRNQLALECAKTMEAKGDWRGAVSIASLASKPDGPLAAEARAFEKSVRLRHEIWPALPPAAPEKETAADAKPR